MHVCRPLRVYVGPYCECTQESKYVRTQVPSMFVNMHV